MPISRIVKNQVDRVTRTNGWGEYSMEWFNIMASVMAEDKDGLKLVLARHDASNNLLALFFGAEREYKRLYDHPFPDWVHEMLMTKPWKNG